MASLRILAMCLICAVVLNCSNYIFMRFRYGDGQRISKYYYPKTVSSVEFQRSLVQTDCDGISCDHELATSVKETTSANTTTIANIDYMPFNYDTDRFCQDLPPGLGPVSDSDSQMSIQDFEMKYGDLNFGGFYQPPICESRHRVAVIIAYRGCRRYLAMFLFVLHPILMKQQLDYQIFVVEQSNNSQVFNRGMLLNIGFREAQKHRNIGWTCFILHEAHIVPTDSRNLYRCSWYPRQLASYVERINKPSYIPKFGGAVAMTSEQYVAVNGFSNNYWGNDADFEDLYNRVFIAKYFVENTIPILGKYKTLKKYSGAERIKSQYMQTVSPLYLLDGLTTLSYTVDIYEPRRMYTYIKVKIGETKSRNYPNKPSNHTTDKPSNSTIAPGQVPATDVM